jgi:hypothetical protein
MECGQIRDGFVKGVPPVEELVQEHLAICPPCRELFAQDAALGRTLSAQARDAQPVADDLLGRMERKLDRESGARAWLRSRPSRLRFTLLLLPLLSVLILGGVVRQRVDFEHYPPARMVLLLCVYFLAIVLAFGKELSDSPRSDAFRDHWGLLVFALAVPALAAFAPATEVSHQADSAGTLGCFRYGALLTAPIAALLWAFDRNDRPSLRTVCLSAAGLGLSANLLLELHCANGNATHVLLGHASLGVAWLAAWILSWHLSRSGRLQK